MLASGVGRRIALAFAEAGATPSSLRSSDDGGRPVPIHFGMDSAAKRQAATRLQPGCNPHGEPRWSLADYGGQTP